MCSPQSELLGAPEDSVGKHGVCSGDLLWLLSEQSTLGGQQTVGVKRHAGDQPTPQQSGNSESLMATAQITNSSLEAQPESSEPRQFTSALLEPLDAEMQEEEQVRQVLVLLSCRVWPFLPCQRAVSELSCFNRRRRT